MSPNFSPHSSPEYRSPADWSCDSVHYQGFENHETIKFCNSSTSLTCTEPQRGYLQFQCNARGTHFKSEQGSVGLASETSEQ